MGHSSRTVIGIGVAGVVLTVLLAGCASGGGDAPTTTATATETVTASPSPSSAPPSTSSPSPSTDGGSSAGGRCAADDLAGSIQPGSGGAAGSVVVHLALQNTGSSSCTLQGWPGVSFVGGGNGTQIGAAATRDTGSPHPTVTLAPGATAVAPLKIGQAGNYSNAECAPRTPDGFRVYPPGSKASVFVRDGDYTACDDEQVGLLSVQALVPEGQATS